MDTVYKKHARNSKLNGEFRQEGVGLVVVVDNIVTCKS